MPKLAGVHGASRVTFQPYRSLQEALLFAGKDMPGSDSLTQEEQVSSLTMGGFDDSLFSVDLPPLNIPRCGAHPHAACLPIYLPEDAQAAHECTLACCLRVAGNAAITAPHASSVRCSQAGRRHMGC